MKACDMITNDSDDLTIISFEATAVDSALAGKAEMQNQTRFPSKNVRRDYYFPLFNNFYSLFGGVVPPRQLLLLTGWRIWRY